MKTLALLGIGFGLACAALSSPGFAAQINNVALAKWLPSPPDWNGVKADAGGATLTGDKWSYLRAPEDTPQVELSATVTIAEPAQTFRFFGEGWSVWPKANFDDSGFEAALLLRAGADSGYRVQFSSKYQILALVKWPEGGYVKVVACPIKVKEPMRLVAKVQGTQVTASMDGREVLRWNDSFLPLQNGAVGLGVSSKAKVVFSNISTSTEETGPAAPAAAHVPNFSVQRFLGGRPWVFDGDEPILLLPTPEANYINNVKLRPGYKPQLSWNSHWDVANQGAYKEATNTNGPTTWSGGGATLQAHWTTQHSEGAFHTQTTMTVGWDAARQVYTYDIDSAMDVVRDFVFRYGYDFEHHTPLDPFRWQYLVARRSGGGLYHRPVYPIDPGPQSDLETVGGVRVWFGRHNEDMHIAPAVEYNISPGESQGRKLNTAVCAAFYDTGVSFPSEKAPAGTHIQVNYRYTGWPAAEAEALFKASKVYPAPTLDPHRFYIFADEWPKLTFSNFVPLSDTWIYGRTPFVTGHNNAPTYDLEKDCGAGSGFAMRLGPDSFAKANLPLGAHLTPGRWMVSALVKSVNAHGPGGRIKLELSHAKPHQVLATMQHFIGNGSFDWTRQGFVFDVPEGADGLSLGMGNAGTGDFKVTDVEFRKLAAGETPPLAILPHPRDQPPAAQASPAGAVAEFRMQEGQGYYVVNDAGGEHLALANLDWVTDSGRPALRFAENTAGKKDYDPRSWLGLNLFGHAQDVNYLASYKSYLDKGRDTVPFAMSLRGGLILGAERYYLHDAYYRGLIGHTLVLDRALGPADIAALAKDEAPSAATPLAGEFQGVTLATWIKPAPQMGKSERGDKGDILGYQNRRYILSLRGGNSEHPIHPPYRLVACINVNDTITAESALEADHWYHVAMTSTPENGQQHIRIYVDGKLAGEGMTKHFLAGR